MVNSNPLVSEITARSINLRLLFILVFLGGLFGVSAQNDPLSAKERARFNEVFFSAEKEKNLGNPEKALQLFIQLHEQNPANATVCYELAQIYGLSEQGLEAISFAEKAVEIDPENKWFLAALASVYRSYGSFDQTIETFEKLVLLDSNNVDYQLELTNAYLRKKDFDKALDRLTILETKIGINELISDHKKQIYLQQGNLPMAIAEMEKLIKANPKQLDYMGSLAQMLMVNQKEEDAIKWYHKMMEVQPSDPRPHLDLSQYYRDKRDFEKSLEHLKIAMYSPELNMDKKIGVLVSLFEPAALDTSLRSETYGMLNVLIEQNPNDPKAFAIFGDFLSRNKDDKQALKMYKRAVSLPGGNLYDIWNQILLIEVQSEMYDSLAVNGAEAVELFPNQPLPYLFTAIGYNAAQNHKSALGYLEAGLPYVIGNPSLKQQFYSQLAETYNNQSNYTKSDQYFEKALTLSPNNPGMLNNYAYYLSVRGEKLDRALELTERCNQLEPNNPVYLDTYAWVLYKQKNYTKALEVMELVVARVGNSSGEVLEHYGDILYQNQRIEDAVLQWKKAKQLGDTSPQIDQKINTQKLVE